MKILYFRYAYSLCLALALLSGMSACKQSTNKLEPQVVANPVTVVDSLPACDTCTNIYLTFDDGPHSGTRPVEDILIRQKVKASFFEVGSQYAYSEDYQLISQGLSANPLFKIYNHTYSHAANNHFNRYYATPDTVWADIQKNKEVLGLHSNITRLPGNNVWISPAYKFPGRKKIAKAVSLIESKGTENIAGWNIEWNFNNKTLLVPPVRDLLNNMDRELKKELPFPKNLVILMHDFMFRQPVNAAKLDSLITVLKERKNIRFNWVEEHPCFKQVKLDSSMLPISKIISQE